MRIVAAAPLVFTWAFICIDFPLPGQKPALPGTTVRASTIPPSCAHTGCGSNRLMAKQNKNIIKIWEIGYFFIKKFSSFCISVTLMAQTGEVHFVRHG